MYQRQRVSRISIDFRALDDDVGVNSNSIIDDRKHVFKFNVEESRTLAFLFTRPRLLTPEVEVHRKSIHGFTMMDFEIFFHERINSCVRDLLSSVRNLHPNDQEHMQERFVHGACEKIKDFLSNTDPKSRSINVDFDFDIIEPLDLGLDLNEDEEDDDESEGISDFIGMKPTSRDATQALEKVVTGKGDLLKTCGVCLDEFLEGMEVKMMPCSHIFHEDCIVQWLGKSNKCPLCRFEMPV